MNELLPMPYETVFSWVTRYHLKVGVGSEKNTYQALFNKSKFRIHAYLPNSIQCLEGRGNLSVEEWINGHTLYPLFYFFGHNKQNKLYRAMLSPQGSSVSHAHIPHAKLSFPYGHKYCPICCKTSRESRGFAYYDIRHQIPGVEVCPMHACYLHHDVTGDYGLDRHLTLPKDDQIVACDFPILIRFARFCFDVFELSQKTRPNKNLLGLYRGALFERGYVTSLQHIRMQLLVEDLSKYYQAFPFSQGWETLSDFFFIGRLIWPKTHSLCHPSKHLLFAFWLFDGIAMSYKYDALEVVSSVEKNESIDRDETCVLRLLKQGVSMQKIHEKTGRSRCYIKRRCELAGITHLSNKSAVSLKVRYQVLVQALLGRHRFTIANNLEVGVSYVEQVIASSQGLSAWRKQFRIMQRVNTAIMELSTAKQVHQDWHRKDYKSHHSKAYFCLYHHARKKLEAIMPAKQKSTSYERNWREEDLRLAKAIKELEHVENMSLTAIAQAIQDKRHLTRKIQVLPNTKALLQKLGKLLPDGNPPE